MYQYYFTWQSPMLEDAGAWHTAELAFCFDNTKRCEQGTGNTPEAQALERWLPPGSISPAPAKSQPAGSHLDAERFDSVPDDGVRQSLPHGRRSGR